MSNNEEKIPGGVRALVTGASVTNGALFGSILGPIGALAGAAIMGAITLFATSGTIPARKPIRSGSQEKDGFWDNARFFAFRDKIVAALSTTPRDESWNWEERTNDAIAPLPAEVRITDAAAETFLKWKIGYDRSNSVVPGLNLLMAVGNGLLGHWGGAAASVVKAVSAAKKQSEEYQEFLDTDRHFGALATIMTAYNAEIESAMLIVLRRATAVKYSDGHGGSSQRFGGDISDLRTKGR